jgi:hypothetical protein
MEIVKNVSVFSDKEEAKEIRKHNIQNEEDGEDKSEGR